MHYVFIKEERLNVKPSAISAWFCPDVAVAEKTLETLKNAKIKSDILTALTPAGERTRYYLIIKMV